MSEGKIIRFFKYSLRKFKAFLFSKDALSFLFFLVLSATFWFVHAVNKNRDANVSIPVNYIEIPRDVTIVNSPPAEIRLNVRDQGKNLFSYSRKRILPLSIDLSQANTEQGTIKLASDQIMMRLTSILRPTTSIISFAPDSIVVQYEKLETVTLPVLLDINIEPAQQYIFSDSIRVFPSEVTVFGRKEILDTLKIIRTAKQNIPKVKESISVKCPLIQPEGVNLSHDEVQVDITVEMFTEKKVHLPVEFINQPQGYSLKAFPAFVDVTYNIGLSHYNTDMDNIQLYVDYRDARSNQQEKQKVHVIVDSPKIFNVRLSPEEIEFILEENDF